MKRTSLLFFLGLSFLVLAGAEYTDSRRNTVRISSVPRKVVVLSPEVQEILFYLGAGHCVKGNVEQCDYPAGARRIEKVGDFQNPDLEKIIRIRPDLVILTDLIQYPVVQNLGRLKLNYMVVYIRDLAELKSNVRMFGDIFGKKEKAAQLIRDLDSLKKREGKRKKVLPLLWTRPLMTAGRDTLIDDVIAKAGGTNMARNAGTGYFQLSEEYVLEKRPDCILLLDKNIPVQNGLKLLLSRERNIRVIRDIDPDLLLRAGPRIIRGIDLLGQALGRE